MGETASRITFWPRLGRWAAELVLVFIGVYAAFWLNNFQQRQQDAERRDRILASIERTLREGIESGKINRVKQEEKRRSFERALNAGEMPPLRSIRFHHRLHSRRFRDSASIWRDPVARLGDADALRNDESVIRWGLSRLPRYQKLSDELIVPNLDQDISFFYDPAHEKIAETF